MCFIVSLVRTETYPEITEAVHLFLRDQIDTECFMRMTSLLINSPTVTQFERFGAHQRCFSLVLSLSLCVLVSLAGV